MGQFVSPREARDGAAVVRWAARDLDGTDGRVAEVGCSWPGMQALADAAAVGPGSPLKAIVAACAGMSTVQRMDVLVSGVPTADFGFLNSAADSLMDANQQTRDWYQALSDEVLAGGDAAYERSFWQQRIPIDSARQIVDNQVPVLLWTGWHHIVGLGALRSYTALQNAVANRRGPCPAAPGRRLPARPCSPPPDMPARHQ
ncbi:CocE/NonD family hydrolase [Frankia sp. Mgl5]|nr:CocE/NonD family hydrolase [Frankia sp. Mgl5]